MFTQKVLKPLVVSSGLTAVLAFISALAGLLVPGFYEPFVPTTELLVGAYAQDMVSVLVAGILMVAILFTWRGSVRTFLVWAGCLVYLIYAYALWSFDAIYTVFLPAYVAILSLSVFSLIGLLGQLDVAAFRRHVDERLRVRLTAVVLALPALMAPPWLVFLVQGVLAGESVSIHSVLVLDLGFVIPASMMTAVLLWQRHKWGFVFAGTLLVKMVTMSSTLVVSTVWGAALGLSTDPVWPLYTVMLLVGAAALVHFWRQIGRPAEAHKKAIRLAER